MNNYITVFESSNIQDLNFYFPLGIFLLLVGMLMYVYEFISNKIVFKRENRIVLFTIGMGCIFFSQSFDEAEQYNNKLYDEYLKGRYSTVEGKVKVLRKQPKEGHAPGDLISINGVEFTINKFLYGIFYTQTIAYGGYLKDGVKAKLFYVNGKIMRVDILETQQTGNSLKQKN